MDGPANEGALCIKGQFAFDFVQHSDRLTQPLVRGEDGQLHPTDWDTALNRAAEGFAKVLAEHGRHAIYGVASGPHAFGGQLLPAKIHPPRLRHALHRQL